MSLLREQQGFRRVAAEILDRADRQDGKPPVKVTVRGLDQTEANQIQSSFQPGHVDIAADRVTIHVDRIIRDRYDGDPTRLLKEWYETLGRTPRRLASEARKAQAAFISVLEALPDHPARNQLVTEAASSIGWISGIWRREGLPAARQAAKTYLAVLTALPAAQPVRLKVFSQRHLRDSHAMDPGAALYQRVADFLLADEEDSTATVAEARRKALADAGLVENLTNVRVLLRGPVGIQGPRGIDQQVAINATRGVSTILTLEHLAGATLAQPAPRWALSVENETTYNEVATAMPTGAAAIYTEGNPNRAVLQTVAALSNADVKVFHWGDIDVGGFRALGRLRQVAPVQAILMDAATLDRYHDRLTPADTDKKASMERHLQLHPEDSIIRECLRRARFLEQEAIPVADALNEVAAQIGAVNRTQAAFAARS